MSTMSCEDSALLQKANKNVANPDENTQQLSDELQKKDSALQLHGFHF